MVVSTVLTVTLPSSWVVVRCTRSDTLPSVLDETVRVVPGVVSDGTDPAASAAFLS